LKKSKGKKSKVVDSDSEYNEDEDANEEDKEEMELDDDLSSDNSLKRIAAAKKAKLRKVEVKIMNYVFNQVIIRYDNL